MIMTQIYRSEGFPSWDVIFHTLCEKARKMNVTQGPRHLLESYKFGRRASVPLRSVVRKVLLVYIFSNNCTISHNHRQVETNRQGLWLITSTVLLPVFSNNCTASWTHRAREDYRSPRTSSTRSCWLSSSTCLIRYASGPDRLGSTGRMILAHRIASGPNPFGQTLAQSAKTKLDQGWFCIILFKTSVGEHNWVWKWETSSRLVASCPKPGPMIPAHQLAFRPDKLSQTLARPSRSDLGWFCTVWPVPSSEKNGTEKDAGSRIWHIWSGPVLAVRWL